MINRRNLLVTALFGLVVAVLLTGLSVYIMTAGYLPTLVSNLLAVQIIFVFLAVLSVAEIPVMIFTLRQMAKSPNPKAGYAFLITNMGYVLFAAVYATAFILLTGQLWFGLGLASLSVVRFITAIQFVQPPAQP